MKKTKILYISASGINRGGVQLLIKSWIENFSNIKNYNIFWYCLGKNDNDKLYKDIEKLGVKIICNNLQLSKKSKYYFYAKNIFNLIKKEKFDIVHINTGLIIETFIAVKIAKINKVPLIISHSHNTSSIKDKHFRKDIKNFLRRGIIKNSDYLLSCSNNAAISMFGRTVTSNNKHKVIKDGIDIDKFYNETKKNKKKNELVFCNIGVLIEQKNQLFLIDVFNEMNKINKNIKLLIAGEGDLKEQLQSKINELNLIEKIILLGEVDNIKDVYDQSDALIFPSKHEGLGMVAIEAQVSGLKCFVSEALPIEAKISNLIEYISLDLNAKEWATIILDSMAKNKNIEVNYLDLCGSGYNIKNVTKQLEEIYKSKNK